MSEEPVVSECPKDQADPAQVGSKEETSRNLNADAEKLEKRLKLLNETLKVREEQITDAEKKLLNLQKRVTSNYEDNNIVQSEFEDQGQLAKRSSKSRFFKKTLKNQKPKNASNSVFSLSVIGNKLSWFTRPGNVNKQQSVTYNLDLSNVILCGRLDDLSGPEYDVYTACIDGWCCMVKLMAESQKRFLKRLKLFEELPSHPNIVKNLFHDVHTKSNRCRVFVEWCQGNLAQVIRDRQTNDNYFTPEQIHGVVLDIVRGIDYLHSYSILHRRISTYNMLVVFDEFRDGEIARVKIGNLELAKVVTNKVIARGRVENQRFAAPEVMLASKSSAYSFSSDIWSFGMILYSLLTLKLPYESLDAESVQNMVQNGRRPENNLDMDESYAPFVELYMECTRAIPEERPTSAVIKQSLITSSSITEQRHVRDMNTGHTLLPSREESRFVENFLVVGCPIGVENSDSAVPQILFQYPADKSLPNSEMILSFCMSHKRTNTRLRRSLSCSKINEKLFASRETIEKSSNFAIFTMLEGNELRYGACVYFEEPVGAVPSFFESRQVAEITANSVSVITDWNETINHRTSSLSSKSSRLLQDYSTSPYVARKREHQRIISEGGIAKKNFVNGNGNDSAESGVNNEAGVSSNYIQFTHRCYVFYSKWPFFKLHFEVLWSVLAQERLLRFSNFNSESVCDSKEGMIYKILQSFYDQPLPQLKLSPLSISELTRSQLQLYALNEPISYLSGSTVESIAEWCYPCMFRSLNPKTIIKLFRALILEEKIVMVSSDSGILTSCIVGLIALLKPYAWQGPFLPLVPKDLESVLDSPVPYVIGFSSLPKNWSEPADRLVVDIDSDQVKTLINFPKMPASDMLLESFVEYSSKIRTGCNVSNPCKTSKSDLRALSKILPAISNWHEQIIGQISSVPSFNNNFKWSDSKCIESLLKSLNSTDREFYRRLISSSHFNLFASSGMLHSVVSNFRSKRDNQKHIEKFENIFNSDINKT